MGRSRLFSSSVLALSLVSGLTVGLPPVPVLAADGAPGELPVSTSPLPYNPPVVVEMPQWVAPAAPVWPSAGSAVVDLREAGVPASFVDGRAGVAGGVSPGGLAVRVTVPGSGAASVEEVEQRLLRGLPAGVGPLPVSAVRVSTFDRQASEALGFKGVLLSVANTGSSVAGSVPAQVTVDYGGFANAYGGNYGDRLRLVAFPACAATTPSVAACREQVPLSQASNDTVSDKVSGVVDLGMAVFGAGPASDTVSDTAVGGSGSVLLAVLAGASSETGDWAATPLPQTANWQAGSSGGDFTYSVPIDVPAGPGGLAPQVSLGYSSGRVDGLNKSKNSQASWVGEGWDYQPGFVERSYRPCIRDGEGSTGGGNLCWVAESESQVYSPVTLVLNGTSTRLVETAANGWKAEDDSQGWRVEHLTGSAVANGAGEAFKVTTRDGTQYLFGSRYAAEGGGVLQVEVYGNDDIEPCHVPGSFSASHCTKPYRWNLDRVVDVHGNVMDLQWSRHRGSYSGVGNNVFDYDIYGRLTEIHYGGNQVTGTGHTNKVVFGGLFRCPSGLSTCAKSEFPDVPWDQHCDEGATSCAQRSPTFFNIYRLGWIDTQVLVSGAWTSVRRWDFEQTFPSHADGTSPSLWLNKVWRPGFANEIYFSSVHDLANRVDVGTGKPATQHYRLSHVYTGTGSRVNVSYSGVDCTPSTLPGASDFNPKRCYPDNDNGTLSWWHKYVVTQVDVEDYVGEAPAVLTQRYQYAYSTLGSSTTTLWKHDQDWHEQPMYRTWSVWAGYPTVTTTHQAADGTGPVQVSEDLFYRGMDDDWTAAGGAGGRTVDLIDGTTSYPDKQPLAGQVARSRVYDGPVNAGRTNWVTSISHVFTATATGTFTFNGGPNPPIYATRVREVETSQVKLSSGPTTRETKTLTEYETGYGLPVKVTDMGSTVLPGDDRCTITEYTPANTTVWLIGLPRQSFTTNCAATPTAADVLSASRTHYDGLAYGVMPTRGLATVKLAAPAVTTYPPTATDYQQQSRSTYDQHGRVRDSFDALDRQTTTSYTPATGGPVTRTTVTGPSINGSRWDTVTDLDPKFGVPTKVTDVNAKVTVAAYDTVGRLTKVWTEHRAAAGTTGVVPNVEYIYNVGAPAFVSTKTLKPDGTQLQSWQIYDGLLRPRQAQNLSATTAGTAITDTRYNGIGQVAKTSTVYSSAAPSGTLQNVLDKDAKVQQRLVYDNLGRVTNTQQWEGNTTTASMLWETLTGYDGEKTTTVTPPAGGTATTTIKDPRGRVTELRQHSGATPASPVATTTTYSYDRLDRLTHVEDTAGNDWFYDYDKLGRKTSTIDPDSGITVTTYNQAGQVTSTTDARGFKLFHEYDALGRKTRTRQDTAAGPIRATWTYDSLAGITVAKGQLTATARFEAGVEQYKQTINLYDHGYRPTSTTYTVPGFGPGGTTLTYTTTNSYKVNGAPEGQNMPGVGGLPAETVYQQYNAITGLLKGLTTTESQGVYIDNTIYMFDGMVYERYLGVAGSRVRIQTGHNAPGRRPSSIFLNTETPGSPGSYGNSKLANDQYLYDQAGNITSIRSTANAVADQQECFRYDHLRRLKEAWSQTPAACPATGQRTGPDPYWRQWTFDDLGNRLTETDKNTTDTTWTHTVGATGFKPHQVSSVTGSGPGAGAARSFTYDAAGNTLTRTTPQGTTQTLTWDHEGHLATVAEPGQATITYTYDTAGNRLIASSSDKKTLYLPDGTELEKIGTADPLGTRHYAGIAVRDTAGLRWICTDHNGTAIAQIDPATLAIHKQRSMPYGQPRGTQAASWKGTKGYLGGTKDPSGLVHLSAREYDPTLGRFISVDPIMDLADPQQWNAYTYGGNNPTTFSDPSGLMTKVDGGGGGLGHNYSNVDGVITYETGYGVPVRINTNTGYTCVWSVCGSTFGGLADIPNQQAFLTGANRLAGSGHYDIDSTAGQLRIAHGACVDGNLQGSNACSGMFETKVGDYANEAMVAEWDPTRWSEFVQAHPGLVEAAQAGGGAALALGLKLLRGGGAPGSPGLGYPGDPYDPAAVNQRSAANRKLYGSGPTYENPGHHDPTGGPNPYNPRKAVLPSDAEAQFGNSVLVNGVRWTKVGNNTYYRYFNHGNDAWHWSGSTNGATQSGTVARIPLDQVPISVRRM